MQMWHSHRNMYRGRYYGNPCNILCDKNLYTLHGKCQHNLPYNLSKKRYNHIHIQLQPLI